jgi:hypothetical protein
VPARRAHAVPALRTHASTSTPQSACRGLFANDDHHGRARVSAPNDIGGRRHRGRVSGIDVVPSAAAAWKPAERHGGFAYAGRVPPTSRAAPGSERHLAAGCCGSSVETGSVTRAAGGHVPRPAPSSRMGTSDRWPHAHLRGATAVGSDEELTTGRIAVYAAAGLVSIAQVRGTAQPEARCDHGRNGSVGRLPATT